MLLRALISCLVALALPAQAADPAAGQRKAGQVCASCHGQDGIGTAEVYPNIAGQSPFYLEKQLSEFRSGARENEQMTIVAQALSDADVENLVAYYAGLKACP